MNSASAARRLLTLVVALVVSVSVLSPAGADNIPKVFDFCSMITLIANPKQFDGKRIRTVGITRAGIKQESIYLSRDSAEHFITANGVGLVLDSLGLSDTQKAGVNLKWVVVEGMYHAWERGETGLRGYIDQITLFYSLEDFENQ